MRKLFLIIFSAAIMFGCEYNDQSAEVPEDRDERRELFREIAANEDYMAELRLMQSHSNYDMEDEWDDREKLSDNDRDYNTDREERLTPNEEMDRDGDEYAGNNNLNSDGSMDNDGNNLNNNTGQQASVSSVTQNLEQLCSQNSSNCSLLASKLVDNNELMKEVVLEMHRDGMINSDCKVKSLSYLEGSDKVAGTAKK